MRQIRNRTVVLKVLYFCRYGLYVLLPMSEINHSSSLEWGLWPYITILSTVTWVESVLILSSEKGRKGRLWEELIGLGHSVAYLVTHLALVFSACTAYAGKSRYLPCLLIGGQKTHCQTGSGYVLKTQETAVEIALKIVSTLFKFWWNIFKRLVIMMQIFSKFFV